VRDQAKKAYLDQWDLNSAGIVLYTIRFLSVLLIAIKSNIDFDAAFVKNELDPSMLSASCSTLASCEGSEESPVNTRTLNRVSEGRRS